MTTEKRSPLALADVVPAASRSAANGAWAIAVAVCLILSCPLASRAEPKAGDHCMVDHKVTLTGTIRGLAAIQQEPGETPQSHFFLDLAQPYCGLSSIAASKPGLIPCLAGDRITVTGDYLAPLAPMNIAWLMIRHIDDCKAIIKP